MNNLLEIREKLQEFYAEYTRTIERILRFILNLAVFFMIQSKLGYMPALSKGIISLAIAVICTFLPRVCTVIIGAVVVLLQMYALSPGILIVVVCVFALIFIFYLRFASNQSIVLLLTVLAFAFGLPVFVPVIAGLAGGLVTLIPLACGTVVFYVLQSAVTYGAGLTSDDSLVTVLTGFAKNSLQNKEMIVAVVAVILGMIIVRTIKNMSVAYSWQIAIVVGSIVSAVVLIAGGSGLAKGSVIVSLILAIIAGLVLQFMIFNVDYSRSEQVQFEDDEYYYYVKAVPKNVAGRKKEQARKKKH
jgi:hypothetical protein